MYINLSMNIKEIITKYPETKAVFENQGIQGLEDEKGLQLLEAYPLPNPRCPHHRLHGALRRTHPLLHRGGSGAHSEGLWRVPHLPVHLLPVPAKGHPPP